MAGPAWGLKKVEPGVIHIARIQYRIVLRLGEIDALCDPKNSDLGKQQRLQILGGLYEPLGSRRLGTRFRRAFDHYRDQVASPRATVAVAEDALVNGLKSEVLVVSGAAAGTPSRLPAPGELGRIRLPGGFTIVSERPLWYPVPHAHRYDAEEAFYSANPLVGALPVIAKVEQRISSADEWIPAPAGLEVHFQLIAPDAIPAGNAAGAPALRTTTRVRGGGGPKKYVDDQLAAHPAVAGDPQGDNCVDARGGKRKPGAGIAADYFETAARKGFNSDRDHPLPAAANSRHTLAVVAKTNDQGEAGVIFRPSRQGGDRFKLRAFLDKNNKGAASDGTEKAAVRADTGTLVVWRTLKISTYVLFNYPAGAAAAAINSAGGNLDAIDFNKLKQDFARAYLELIVERTGARKRRRIGDALWVRATNYARRATPARPRGVSQRYDINALFPNANNIHGLIRILLPAPYNAARGAGFPAAPAAAATRSSDWQALLDKFLENFIRYFSRDATAGLVVVQAPFGDTITANSHVAGPAVDLTTSGLATVARGCYLFYGHNTYGVGMPYDIQDNTVHEIGHCLFLPHQWTDRNAATGAVSGGVAAEHDYEDYCIMSYQRNVRNNYDYCGRCNLKLRGWNTRGIPKNN